MSKTNELRKLIMSMLNDKDFINKYGIKSVSFEGADDDEMYPHIVFEFDTINLGDLSRDDLSLIVDIWDKSETAVLVEDIADDIEEMFQVRNLPQDKILPTFFLENRRSVKDEDKKIKHRQLEILIQNYEGE